MDMIEEIFNKEFFRELELYSKLRKKGLLRGKYYAPFIPYVGKDYFDAQIKILFVGKQPDRWWGDIEKVIRSKDWDEGGITLSKAENYQIEKLASLTTKFIDSVKSYFAGNESIKRGGDGYYSRFWRIIYLLAISLLNSEPKLFKYVENKALSDKCFNSIAYTNVFKICSDRREPDEDMIKILMEKFNTLKEEIEHLKPNLIIFSTGWRYDKHLKEIFGDNVIPDDENTDYVVELKLENVNDKTLVLRTRHFQALSNDQLERLYDYIVENL